MGSEPGAGRIEERVEEGRADVVDATRRTHLASERTLLAWWRSGLAALAVAIGVGKLLPDIGAGSEGALVALGVGFAVYGIALVVAGTLRQRALDRALDRGGFRPLGDGLILTLGLFGVGLAIATVFVIVL